MEKELQDILDEIETGVEFGVNMYNVCGDISFIDIGIKRIDNIMVILKSNMNAPDIPELYDYVSEIKNKLIYRYKGE